MCVFNRSAETCVCVTDQLERVFLRLGHAETDEQLQDIISKFLPPVLLKLSSVQEGVRKKVSRCGKARRSLFIPIPAGFVLLTQEAPVLLTATSHA